MWRNPGTPVSVHPSQLVPGLYVWLNVRWDEHPFISNRFLIKHLKDVAVIQSLGIDDRVFYFPEKSSVTPPEYVPPPPTTAELEAQRVAQLAAERAALQAEIKLKEEQKRQKRQRQRDAATRAERSWEDAARKTREALLTLQRSPKAAGQMIADLSNDTASAIARSKEVLLHLLGDKKEQGPQFHALNVLTLCMLLGKKAGLTERELSDLAMAALAHDAGKVKVPAQLFKTIKRKKHEEAFVHQHVMFSYQLANESGAFSKDALAAIADHHEALDGTGFPRARREMSRQASILALVNRYDNLCTPEALDQEPLMPAEALSHMFRSEASRYDAALLGALVKMLGVYPPGTVVQLSDGSLALVVAPGPESLRPQVLVYSPDLPKDEAPVVELHTEPELKIAEALRPSTLPLDVLKWLNPQQRLSYYFSVEPAN